MDILIKNRNYEYVWLDITLQINAVHLFAKMTHIFSLEPNSNKLAPIQK